MNKDVVLVFRSDDEANHWMVDRQLKRAGLDKGEFTKLVWDSTILDRLDGGSWKVAIVFGEDCLYSVLGKTDILRWFNRTVPLQLRSRSILVRPCLEPSKLLARRYEEDEGRKKRGMRHPPRYQGAVVDCLKNSLKKAVTGHSVHKTSYLQDPTPQKFKEWVDNFYRHVPTNPLTALSWDIETPYKISEDDEDEYDEETRKREKTILRISFAYVAGSAVSIPWLAEYLPDIKRLLAYSGYHIGHNSVAFDIPVVEANDVHVGGTMLDGMDAWHLYQTDLDKGLEHVTGYYTDLLPWKHLADTLPALYSCIDADAALRNMEGILVDLERVGLKDRFFEEMEIIKILNEAGKRGNNVDEKFRLELKAELETKLYTMLVEAQGLVDRKFLKYKLYKRLPKTADPEKWSTVELSTKVQVCSSCGKERITIKHKCPNGETWEKQPKTIPCVHYYRTDGLEHVTNLEQLNKYLSTGGFNPCSADQMKKYMRFYHHPVGKNHKTKKDSADVKHLQKLVKKYGSKHPIYAHTLQIRLLQKALSTYVNGLEPDESGRVHTTYVNSPSTWRLGARNINVQNLGKRNANPYAKKARAIIIPSTDHVLVQADSSAIEAVFVGDFMRDQAYIDLARKGIHGYVTGKFLGETYTAQSFTAADNERIKTAHPEEYDKFKRVGHATNYGMGPYLMHMNEPEIFPHVKDVERVQDFIFKELPGLPKWHHQLRMAAQKNGYLDNPWGLRHYFYDVFTYNHDEDGKLIFGDDGLPSIKLGKDGKRVIAFKPQSSAGMFMRDNIKLIAATEAREWMPAIISIHDGYTLDVPYHSQDTAVNILGEILTRKIQQMNDLQVGCEIEIMEQNFLKGRLIKRIEIGG